MDIAIIGSGISGLVCAHLLHDKHRITLFEAADRLGGHTNTVTINLGTKDRPEVRSVDTGFIVYNERNYPNFVRLLDRLGVATHPSEMSFSVASEVDGTEYRGTNLNSLFAQRRNALRPRFWGMLRDIGRFNRDAANLLTTRPDSPQTLGEFLDVGGYGDALRDLYLIPMGAAIWSADPTTFDEYPAATLFRFLDNHGLISLGDRPAWRTISGGAKTYVDRLIVPFEDRIRLNTPIEKVVRRDDNVEVLTAAGESHSFDHVIMATHSDQALRLLGDPSDAEQEVLGAIKYQPNTAILHTDAGAMPRSARAWASWNYRIRDSRQSVPVLTYDMNRLQGLSTSKPVFVTLNDEHIDPKHELARFSYAHPVFDREAVAAQQRRHEINGPRHTYFAGAYWGYGFHEDGVNSALSVCEQFGATL